MSEATVETTVAVIAAEVATLKAGEDKCQLANLQAHQALHDRISGHCNGQSNHVSRREMDACTEAIERLTGLLQSVSVQVAALQSEQTLWGKLQIPIATGIVMAVVVAALNRLLIK